jgi:hypothetical protein
MAKTETMSSKKVMTPEFRVSFPNVFQPRSAFDGQEAKYSIVMLFSKKTDISALKKLAQAVAREKWGDKIPKGMRNPFRDGDVEKEGMDGYAGCVFVTASSKTKPGLVDQSVQPIITGDDFYAGCYARATVNAFAYDRAGNVGVSFGLQNIQKLRDGEPFSGRTKAEDEFSAVMTEEGQDAPAVGGKSDDIFG